MLYERLAAMLTPAYFARDGIDVTSIAAEHGVERANLTDFQAETILAEFQIFRGVLFDMLDAHDLRQPVTNVLLAADLILQLDSPPMIADWTRRIAKNGERIATMLGELLDALSVPPVTGWWNRSALERAVENLVGNAQKYGDPGAPIDVTVGESNGRVILSVRNQGEPIPPEEFETIFQQFVRSKTAGESTTGGWGVGLPYVRTVAQSHGGSAVVYSDAGTGTVFVIDMPVDARPFQQGDAG